MMKHTALVTHVVPASGQALGTIVAFHGLAESAECLLRVATGWATSRWNVVVPDMRGHGGSPAWTPDELRSHPGDVLTEDAVRLLDSPILDSTLPVVLYGHSAGGSVAIAAAATRRERVSGVIVEDPFWRLPVTKHQDRDVAIEAHREIHRLQSMTEGEIVADQAAREPAWLTSELAPWARAKATMDPALILHGDVIPSPPWPELIDRLHEAGVPVLVVTGTDRTGIRADHQRIIRERGGEVVVVDGASHSVRRDHPAEFEQVTAEFLATIPEQTPTARTTADEILHGE